ncbi:hypothetical protein [Haloechinothrix alba]|nr:hypothetical protein [Haloechinothrix alba]
MDQRRVGSPGNGLTGLRERLERVSASLTAGSSGGEFTVTVNFAPERSHP